MLEKPHKKLDVWKKSLELVKGIYTLIIIRDIVLQRLPLVLLVLGVTSIGLIAAVDHISRSMRQAFLHNDIFHEMQIELSKAHLALEDDLRGIQGQDISLVWQGIDKTEAMITAALSGGRTQHGRVIQPLQDENMRKDMKDVRTLVAEFRELAQKVYKNRTQQAEMNPLPGLKSGVSGAQA